MKLNPRSLAPRSLLIFVFILYGLRCSNDSIVRTRIPVTKKGSVFIPGYSRLGIACSVCSRCRCPGTLPSVREVPWPSGTFGKHRCRWLSTGKGSCSWNELQNQELPPESAHIPFIPSPSSQTPETWARCTGIPYLPFSQLLYF